MTIKERDSLKVGDEITVISKPYTWQGVNGTSSISGRNRVSYPYTCKISKIDLYQSSPAFNCENNYGWCITNKHLNYYKVNKFTPKVGDWVTITRGRDWASQMDKFIGKTVKITKLSCIDAIDFKEKEGFTYRYSKGAYRPATQEEIDSVTSSELPESWAVKLDGSPECEVFKKWRDNIKEYTSIYNHTYYGKYDGQNSCWNTPPDECKLFTPKEFVDKFINKSTESISNALPNSFYVDVSKGTPEQLETFTTWYYKEIGRNKDINYTGVKEQEWNYYGFANYEKKDYDRHDSIDYMEDNYTLYTIEEFIHLFLSSTITINTDLSNYNTWADTRKENTGTTSIYIPEKAFKETQSKQKIIFNHKLISPTIKIVRRNQKIKF